VRGQRKLRRHSLDRQIVTALGMLNYDAFQSGADHQLLCRMNRGWREHDNYRWLFAFSTAEARPHLIFVRAGTLDDLEIAKPAVPIWTSQAPSWACINGDIPKVDGQTPPAA
jgi:hypothetical protein